MGVEETGKYLFISSISVVLPQYVEVFLAQLRALAQLSLRYRKMGPASVKQFMNILLAIASLILGQRPQHNIRKLPVSHQTIPPPKAGSMEHLQGLFLWELRKLGNIYSFLASL